METFTIPSGSIFAVIHPGEEPTVVMIKHNDEWHAMLYPHPQVLSGSVTDKVAWEDIQKGVGHLLYVPGRD